MACSLTNRPQIKQLVLDGLETITSGNHVAISMETKLDGAGKGLGYDPLAVRGWCGFFREKISQRGCAFGLTPDDFEGFKKVGDIVDAICTDLGIEGA